MICALRKNTIKIYISRFLSCCKKKISLSFLLWKKTWRLFMILSHSYQERECLWESQLLKMSQFRNSCFMLCIFMFLYLCLLLFTDVFFWIWLWVFCFFRVSKSTTRNTSSLLLSKYSEGLFSRLFWTYFGLSSSSSLFGTQATMMGFDLDGWEGPLIFFLWFSLWFELWSWWLLEFLSAPWTKVEMSLNKITK